MHTTLRCFLSFVITMSISLPLSANTLTDVGTGAIPDYDPAYYDPASGLTGWTLSSTCIDINESGQVACRTLAQGPIVRCGFRGKKRCSSKVAHVYRWNGTSLERISDSAAKGDTPLVMNNAGEIAGYEYQSARYPNGGNNGRIWHDAQNIEATPVQVTSINDRGDYILKYLRVEGGQTYYSGVVNFADGTERTFPGVTLIPAVVANNGEVMGNQEIQTFLPEWLTANGLEVPPVFGTGWFLDQADVDALKTNAAGIIDDDPMQPLWPLYYYATTVFDANDFGDFVAIFPGQNHSSMYCSHEGETRITDRILGIEQILPWSCFHSGSVGINLTGSKAFIGINNHGDIVGSYTPTVSGVYTSNVPSNPGVWLVNSAGGLDDYNANDLLPAGSDYTITSVFDINDNRQIAGTCLNAEGVTRGCILNLTDLPVPVDTILPTVRVVTEFTGAVTDVVTLDAVAWDKQSKIKKVKFQLGETLLAEDTTRPYSIQWDTSTFASGTYNLKVIAVDNAGNRSSQKVLVTVSGGAVTPPPGTTPPATGTVVEGAGTIDAIGADYVDTNGIRLFYDVSTVLKFNDVPGFSLGLPVQYKAVQDVAGIITGTRIEVN